VHFLHKNDKPLLTFTIFSSYMKKHFLLLLLLAFVAYGQVEFVAVLNTVDDEEPPIRRSELNHLTDRLREIAVGILPKSRYNVMTTESIISLFESMEDMLKECSEASCIVDLGRKITADYVAQGRIGRFGKRFTIKVELYDSKSGSLVDSFTGVESDLDGLLSVLDAKAPGLFRKMPGVASGSAIAPSAVQGGIANVNVAAAGGAGERFGFLRIKPAYSENVGSDKPWNLTIGGKAYSSFENDLPAGSHKVKLSHECYEDINFDASIENGKFEVFEMSKYLNLKQGTLVLTAEKGGEPASEAVFVNGKRVGETPFSGSVPVV
jgi:TolB-like protein